MLAKLSGALIASSLFLSACICRALDLAPRVYLITPVHSNAATLTYSICDGGIEFEGAVSIADATARVSVPMFSYYHSFNFFGRSANIAASLPYGVGHFRGSVAEEGTLAYRSGLLAPTFRFSVNLIGGPAMDVKEFREWRQKTILGASFRSRSTQPCASPASD